MPWSRFFRSFLIFLIPLLWVVVVWGVKNYRAKTERFALEPHRMKGPMNAAVTLVEFSDFGCHYCAELQSPLKELLVLFPQDLKLQFKHFPMDYPQAPVAAAAAECAADQGQFWPYHDLLFERRMEWIGSNDIQRQMEIFAGALGLDGTKFRECLDSQAKKEVIEKNKKEASDNYANGRPTLLLVGRGRLPHGSKEKMEKIIREEIAKSKAP